MAAYVPKIHAEAKLLSGLWEIDAQQGAGAARP